MKPPTREQQLFLQELLLETRKLALDTLPTGSRLGAITAMGMIWAAAGFDDEITARELMLDLVRPKGGL